MVELSEYEGEDRLVVSFDKADELHSEKERTTLKCNLPSLNYFTDGFAFGELISISGVRKSGKTLLAQTLTTHFAEKDIRCLWFSYEVTDREMFKRYGLDIPYFVMPNKKRRNDLNWLKERVIEGIVKYNIQVVFIDHLHYLLDMAKAANISIEIGQVIRFLKSLAVELEIVIFLMCHMTKLEPEKEPSSYYCRDSSFIEQESDTVFIIWRSREVDNLAHVKVEFHRRTGVMEKRFELKKQGNLFVEETDGRYGEKELSKDAENDIRPEAQNSMFGEKN